MGSIELILIDIPDAFASCKLHGLDQIGLWYELTDLIIISSGYTGSYYANVIISVTLSYQYGE